MRKSNGSRAMVGETSVMRLSGIRPGFRRGGLLGRFLRRADWRFVVPRAAAPLLLAFVGLAACAIMAPSAYAWKPDVQITGGGEVTEGEAVTVTVTFSAAQATDTTVRLLVEDRGEFAGLDYLAPSEQGLQTVVIPAGKQSATYTVQTQYRSGNHQHLISPPHIRVSIRDDRSYVLGVKQNSVGIRVTNRELMVSTGCVGCTLKVTEGESVNVTVTANHAPKTDLRVRLDVQERGVSQGLDYLAPSEEGLQTVIIPAGQKSARHTVQTQYLSANDESRMSRPEIWVWLLTGQGYERNIFRNAAPIFVKNDTTPPGTDDPPLAHPYASLIAKMYGWRNDPRHKAYTHTDRWDRALLAFEQSVSDSSLTPMTAAEAQAFADRGWTRWVEVAKALQEIENSQTGSQTATTPPAAEPELSLSAGAAVDEGTSAAFTIAADPAPEADLTVDITVAQTGDYLDAPGAGSRTVTLTAGATSTTLALATLNDTTNEPDGSVSVTLDAGTGYTVAAGQASGTVAVRDDDEPVVSIAAGAGVTEGTSASFTVTATPAPAAPLEVTLTVGQSGDFAAAGEVGSKTVTIPTSGSVTLEVATVNDATDEPNGSVSATVAAGKGYTVAVSPDDTASVAVADDDATATTDDDDAPSVNPHAALIAKMVEWRNDPNWKSYKTHTDRWDRALLAFGQSVSDSSLTPMTAAEAQAFADRGMSRWVEVAKALQEIENSGQTATTPPAADPEVSISGGSGVSEGASASFTVTATPAPATPLDVTLTVGQSGDYAAAGQTGSRKVTIPTGGSVTLEIATVNDATDEPDGSVSVTIVAGTGYTVGSARTQTVSIADDDVPVIIPALSLSAGTAVDEGGNAVFTVHADAAPAADLTVALTVAQTGDVLGAPGAGSRQLTLAAGATSATLTLATDDDGVDEPDGSVSVTLDAGAGYAVAASPGDAASVAVRDNDDPVISIAAGAGVTEGAPASFTLTAAPVPHAALTVSLAVTQSGDFAASGQTGTRQVTIPTGGSVAFEVATVNDSADEPDGSVTATLAAGAGYAVAASPDDAAKVAVADDDVAAVPEGPTLSVNDVEVKEGPYRRVTFTVTLSEASDRYVSFYYQVRESDPVSAKRNADFWGPVSKQFAGMRPGETEYRIKAGMVVDDSHDEDPETFEIVLSDANGAAIADAVGVATIVNDDPLPAAFLARFGRTVADQALEGIAARMAAPRTPGMQGMVAGQALSFDPGASGRPAAGGAAVLPRSAGSQAAPGSWSGTSFGSSGEASRTMTLREALSGSSFTLTGDVDGAGGTMAFWGQAPGAGGHAFATQFAGADRASELRLSGETASALLGADYARGPWLVGFALSQSTSEGDYAQDGAGDCSGQPEAVCALAARAGAGEVEASLTATVPYAAYDVSERLRLWGAVGQGAGDVTVTTGLGGSYRADTRWSMAAAGLRGELLAPPAEGSPGSGSGAGGLSLALVSDAMWVRTSSEKTRDLAASESDVSRLRLGLEGSWGVALAGGASLTPRLELGARHDGGDAETGSGVELGGGLSWVDPGLGLSLDLSGRTLVAHDDSALEDRGVSASLVFAPDASGGRGPSFSLGQDWGGQAQGGLDALFAPAPLEEREDGGKLESRWTAEAAWGFPALGGRFTGSPHIGLGLATGARDYTLGWRLAPATGAGALSLGVTATRRENDAAPAEHTVGIEAAARW